ncbi:ankyrin repeat-containing domain protein [Xylariales sp. PMI_506]|nr:ankyrin repeat-containing domain protein [Xylariales sp. PMI_506]
MRPTCSGISNAVLLDLPIEILWNLGEYLPAKNLSKLAQTSKACHQVWNRELYNRDRNHGGSFSLIYACFEKTEISIFILQRYLEYFSRSAKPWDHHFSTPTKLAFYEGKLIGNLTPLMVAIQADNLRVVKFLIDNGAEVNLSESTPGHIALHHDNGWYPLQHNTLWYPIHHAVMVGYGHKGWHFTHKNKLKIIRVLLQNGANANQTSTIPATNHALPLSSRFEGVVTPLHLAIVNNANAKVIHSLLLCDATPKQSVYEGIPNQHFSKISPISCLINKYDDLTEDQYKSAALMIACGAGSGLESKHYTVTGQPLLFECLAKPSTSKWTSSLVKLLLEEKISEISSTSTLGEPIIAYHLKRYVGWEPKYPYEDYLILSHELRIDMERAATFTCESIQYLLDYGANINSTNPSHEAPLHIAIGLHRNYGSIFEFLLEKGANTNAITSDGHTLLHCLLQGDCQADHQLITRLIKGCRIPRNARDRSGSTFLHYLCTSTVNLSTKWIQEAVNNYKRSDWHIKNKAKKKPLQLATAQDLAVGNLIAERMNRAYLELHEATNAANDKCFDQKPSKKRRKRQRQNVSKDKQV